MIAIVTCRLEEVVHVFQGAGGMGQSCRKDRAQDVTANVVPNIGVGMGVPLACSAAFPQGARGWGLQQRKLCQQRGKAVEAAGVCWSRIAAKATEVSVFILLQRMGKCAYNAQVAYALGSVAKLSLWQLHSRC